MRNPYGFLGSSVAAAEVLRAQYSKAAGLQWLYGSDNAEDTDGSGSGQDVPVEHSDNLEDGWTSNSISEMGVVAATMSQIMEFNELNDHMLDNMFHMEECTATSEPVTSTNTLDIRKICMYYTDESHTHV